MSWCYRVMRHESEGPPYFAIHEVYSDPPGWTSMPAKVGGDSIEELRGALVLMRVALEEPVLDFKTGEEVTDDR